MAKKSLGQHFLKNKAAINAIVAALDPQPNETIIEIGPGHGELTRATRDKRQETNIIAIEKDEELCERLKRSGMEGVEIIYGDALVKLPELLSDPQSAQGRAIHNYKIAGNIPYYITGHLLRVISELSPEKKPERCVFTIQREVAERIVAQAPHMNRLAASVAYWADAKITMNLSREDFSPVPKVTSAIIALTTKKEPAFPNPDKYYSAVRALFSQPRKIILNNLAGGEGQIMGDKEKISIELKKLAISPESRPQDLSIEEIAKIAEVFF
jgi:16S rRNA (adenine1518-N6/adenine1519-N6)-dimethyltransferase